MKGFWITWETQRRNRELASALGMELNEFDFSSKPSGVRYVQSIVSTIPVLFGARGSVVVVQAPSLVLLWLATFFKFFFRYSLFVDAHNAVTRCALTNTGICGALTRFSFRQADAVIVSNQGLASELAPLGVRTVTLRDRLPQVPKGVGERSPNGSVVLIASFAVDEPIAEFIEGFIASGSSKILYVTGKRSRAKELLRYENDRVIFTDYLDEERYWTLLVGADLLVVLTTNENCLVCGAYEALALGVPCLLSDKRALRDTFRRGFAFSQNSRTHYAGSIVNMATRLDLLAQESREFRVEFVQEWERELECIKQSFGLT